MLAGADLSGFEPGHHPGDGSALAPGPQLALLPGAVHQQGPGLLPTLHPALNTRAGTKVREDITITHEEGSY